MQFTRHIFIVYSNKGTNRYIYTLSALFVFCKGQNLIQASKPADWTVASNSRPLIG